MKIRNIDTGEIKESESIPAGWMEFIQPAVSPSGNISKTIYQKTDFVKILIDAGLANTLGVLLDNSPVTVREQWYAYQTIDITDPRVVAFFQQAGVDLGAVFK